MLKLKHNGFSLVQVLMVLVIVGLVGGTGYYVWHSNNETKDTQASTENAQNDSEKSEEVAEPTSDWITYKNTAGVFTLKHPKTWVTATKPELCSEGLVLFGADAASVGACASDSGGQMSVSSSDGDLTDEYAFDEEYYTDITSTVVVVDGIQGAVSRATAQGAGSEDFVGGYADGTKVVQYLFYANNGKTYRASYVQKSDYPDALADFETMVTKTLKFSL